jgi:hypothetical protein
MAWHNMPALHKESLRRNSSLLGSHVIDKSEGCGHIWDTAGGESLGFSAMRIRVNLLDITMY